MEIIQYKNKYYCKTDTGYREVLATVDSSLGLPQPSQGFIEKYVKMYNQGNPITEVLVEFDNKKYCGVKQYKGNRLIFDNTSPNPNYGKIKVNPKDNTITIYPIKDNWSREELLGNGKGSLDEFLLNSTLHTQEERELIIETLSKWMD